MPKVTFTVLRKSKIGLPFLAKVSKYRKCRRERMKKAEKEQDELKDFVKQLKMADEFLKESEAVKVKSRNKLTKSRKCRHVRPKTIKEARRSKHWIVSDGKIVRKPVRSPE